MTTVILDRFFNVAEDQIDFDSFVKFSLLMFRVVFFNFRPLNDNATIVMKVKYYAMMTYYGLCMLVFFVAMVQMIVYAITHSDNFVSAASAIPNAVSVLLISNKAFLTFLRKNDIWKIFLELRALFSRTGQENEKRKLKKYLDMYHRIIKVYAGIFVVLYIPVVGAAIPYLINGTMQLTVNYWFPFDAYKFTTFPIALFWADLISGNALILLMAADSLLFAMITVIAMEFDFLKDDMEQLTCAPKEERNKKFVDLVQRHSKLLELSEKLEDIYGLTFLVSFVISSLIMCFVAFQLSIAETNISAYMFYIPYLGMVGGQILLLCWFGQKLMNSSVAVADGVYDSDWMDVDDSAYKRQLVLVILRSQRTQKLTAMKFADVSLASFTTVRNKS